MENREFVKELAARIYVERKEKSVKECIEEAEAFEREWKKYETEGNKTDNKKKYYVTKDAVTVGWYDDIGSAIKHANRIDGKVITC